MLRFGTPVALLIFVMLVSVQLKDSQSGHLRDSNSNFCAFRKLLRVLARKISPRVVSILPIALIGCGYAGTPPSPPPVSYTHLDVYKRQVDVLGGA